MKKYIRAISLGVYLCLVCVPLSLHAAPVLRSGTVVEVSDTQEVPNDFYAVGGKKVEVLGKVTGDLYAVGQDIIVKGEVTQDVVVMGATVRIDGPVGDDVRMIGGKLVISGTVEGDVLVVSGDVEILSTARINGDLLFAGEKVVVDGDLRGSLSAKAQTVRINGPVLGVVSAMDVQNLELGDQAHIEGAITYSSPTAINRAPGSVVSGDIERKELLDTSDLLPVLVLFFTTLVYLLCKRKTERLMKYSISKMGRHGLLGIGLLVAMPVLGAVLVVSRIGSVVGVALLLAYLLLLVVAVSLVGIFVGALLSYYFQGEVSVSLKWALLGTLLSVAILYIPYVGIPLLGVAALILIGGVSSLFFTRMRY